MPAVWSFVYGTIGQAIEIQGPEPAAPPAGRVMQFQAIDAGERIHRVLGKVPVYRQATAIVGGGILEDLAELVAAPMLVAVMASNETARETLWPILAQSLQKSAVAIAKAQKEQAASMRAVGEYQEEAEQLVGQMFSALFAPRDGGHDDGGDGAQAGG